MTNDYFAVNAATARESGKIRSRHPGPTQVPNPRTAEARRWVVELLTLGFRRAQLLAFGADVRPLAQENPDVAFGTSPRLPLVPAGIGELGESCVSDTQASDTHAFSSTKPAEG